MPTTSTSSSVRIVNFAAGIALLLTLFPVGGKLPEKPAGYRTALELLDKRSNGFAAAVAAAAVTAAS